MSAPQIPNLNTLRRGRRWRGRGGFSGEDSGRHGSSAAKDRVVQGTDNDASVSRLSAVSLGYLDDPFAKALTPLGAETRRLPIINRGTYVRTTAIDNLVARFLDPQGTGTGTGTQNDGRKKQIISLGAGSDTRVFRLLASTKHQPNFVYHEIDFPVNTVVKVKAIRSSPLLQRTLGIQRPEDVTVSEAGDALHSPSYHIHPLDLRALAQHAAPSSSPPVPVLSDVDAKLPTLLISECCLVYLSPSEAADVVGYFTRTLFGETPKAPLGLILYEPIRPDDAFGRTMVSNLAARGIHLQTLHQYASLEAQRKRLQEHGFHEGQAAADIDFLWERWVSDEEKERVATLEMLDEMEEWRLLAQHYCVAWGWREGDEATAFDGWKEIQAQPGE